MNAEDAKDAEETSEMRVWLIAPLEESLRFS
jgi:hypothetical protein